MLRTHKRIHCLVNDCHYKLAKWLCENYRTQGMVRRGQRCIGFKTARAMCTWLHYHFQQHLIHKAREHKYRRIHKQNS